MSTGRAASTNRSIDSRSDSDNDLLLVDIANYDCNELKRFLDAVYNYRSPRDKIGQDKRFLKLLKQAEDEEKNLRVVSSDQHSRNISTASSSTGPVTVKVKTVAENIEASSNSKSLEDVSSTGEKSNQTRTKCTSGNFRRMYCNGYGPENDEESVHLNDDSFDDIGVLRHSDENSDYSDDSDESEHLSSMAKGVTPLCMDKVLTSKAEHARITKRRLAEIRESIKPGQESDQQPEIKTTTTTTSHDDLTKKSKHVTRRSRRETEIKIDYYSTNNIDALVYHINSGATKTIEEALAATTTNHPQNKPRNKASKMKKYRSFEDLRNTKKSHSGSKKNSAGATPSLPSSNQQKSKLKKSSSLENLNNNKKKNSAKRNTSSEAFLEGVAAPSTATITPTIIDPLPVQELPIKTSIDFESGIVDSFDDFHEVKKRRKKTRGDVTNPVEKLSKKLTVTTKPIVTQTKSAPVKSLVQPMKTATATPTNCDTKHVQLAKSSNDDKKSSYAEIMKSRRLTTDNSCDTNNNSIRKTLPSVNGYGSASRKLIVIDGNAIDTNTNNHTLKWVNKYQNSGECAHFHEQFVNYLYNTWLDTVNKRPQYVYYTESTEIDM